MENQAVVELFSANYSIIRVAIKYKQSDTTAARLNQFIFTNPWHSKIDTSKLAVGVILQARRLCRSRRETAFSPESTAGSSEARFNGSPFCASRERRRSLL